MKKKKPTLKEIDGSIKGYAALVSIDMTEPFDPADPANSLMYSDFTEGESETGYDPYTLAVGLRESLWSNWPGRDWNIFANPRAKYLRWKYDMDALGLGVEHTPKDYLASFD